MPAADAEPAEAPGRAERGEEGGGAGRSGAERGAQKMADAFGDELFSVFEAEPAAARGKAAAAEAARRTG